MLGRVWKRGRAENLGDFVVDFRHDVEEGEESFMIIEWEWLVVGIVMIKEWC